MPRARGGLKQLRHLGTIEKRDAPLADYADSQPDWEPFTTGWFSIKPLSGVELTQARQVESQVTHEIFGRYVAGVTSAMRLKLSDGRIFHFVGTPTEFENKHWIRIQAIEAVSDYGTS
jgi:SPP1 family predicted phage head-tail adaptor